MKIFKVSIECQILALLAIVCLMLPSAALAVQRPGHFEPTSGWQPTDSKIAPQAQANFNPVPRPHRRNAEAFPSLSYPNQITYPMELPATEWIDTDKGPNSPQRMIFPIASYAAGHHSGWHDALRWLANPPPLIQFGNSQPDKLPTNSQTRRAMGPMIPSTSDRYLVDGMNDGYKACITAANALSNTGHGNVQEIAARALTANTSQNNHGDRTGRTDNGELLPASSATRHQPLYNVGNGK